MHFKAFTLKSPSQQKSHYIHNSHFNKKEKNMEENMNRTQDHQSSPHRRVKPPETAQNHQPPPPQQKCPRCDSSNTKFCYYNNYSLSQPRYICKGCRRYWTHGGTQRNVPIGGGCRKIKRAKISTASSSTTEIARTTQALPVPTHPKNVAGMDPGQGSMTGMGNNSFYTGGTLFSSLAALQTLPAGINQPPPASLNPAAAASCGGGRFGANMGLWQGMGLSSLRPQQPQQYQANNGFISSQHQSLIPMSSWSQGFVNRGGGGADGDQVGSSFNISNQWSSDMNNHQGFNPSQ